MMHWIRVSQRASLFFGLWCAGLAAQPCAGASVTIIVSNLPAAGATADGQAVACVGSLNGWNTTANVATVAEQRLVFAFGEVGSLAPLGGEWQDAPAGANAAFRFVKPGTWDNVIKTDFLANDGNFRLALVDGGSNTVVIRPGVAPLVTDQATAVRVNDQSGSAQVLVDPARFAFPGGRWKALIMSYDDGHVQDRSLVPIFNAYGIRGTFHLNSGFLDQDTFITSGEVAGLFAGHEVSLHTVDHPDLTQCNDATVQWETTTCRSRLTSLAGYPVNTMSYPFGAFNQRVINLVSNAGANCARTVLSAAALNYLPPNYLKWHPTVHHTGAAAWADELVSRTNEDLALLFVWGHSYELDYGYADNSWAYMTSLCQTLGNRGDIWYAGMGDVRYYLAAIQALGYPASNGVHNPSGDITVWAKLDGKLGLLQPRRTVTWPAGAVRLAPAAPAAGSGVTFVYQPAGNMLGAAKGVWLRIGYDGWQAARDVQMSPGASGMWTCAYAVSNGARRLDWAFHDGQGVWDDNLGGDWSLAVRPGVTGMPAAVFVVPGAPVVSGPPTGGQNHPGDAFDLDTAGGCLVTSNQGGFGSFGKVYLNYDATNLYIGAVECDLAGSNNAMIVFIVADALRDGVANLWNLRGTPYGLEYLHNVGFAPAVGVAIVLGDEYGDGGYPHFNLGNGYDYGQGVYRLSTNATFFTPVSGARLSQYDGVGGQPTTTADDDGNRLADRWEAAIPWTSLGIPLGIRSIGALHISGLITSHGVSGNDRYLSANYLGASAAGTLDIYGNYGFNFVSLVGRRVGLTTDDSDCDGAPDYWEICNGFDPCAAADAESDADADGQVNRDEYWAGTEATNAASVFKIYEITGNADYRRMAFASVAGKEYVVQYRTNLIAVGAWTDWLNGLTATGALTSLDLPVAEASRVYYRLKLAPP